MQIQDALSMISGFRGADLGAKVAAIESRLVGLGATSVPGALQTLSIDRDLLAAAASIKRASAQIDVLIHVLGILYCLPHLMDKGESIAGVSLGAGNSSAGFDLETDRRVAEFKFIQWKGADAVRKKSLFEDFVKLGLYDGPKRRMIYLFDVTTAQAFLRGKSSIERVLDRNARLRRKFVERYGTRFTHVSQFYEAYRSKIELVDLGSLVPELAGHSTPS